MHWLENILFVALLPWTMSEVDFDQIVKLVASETTFKEQRVSLQLEDMSPSIVLCRLPGFKTKLSLEALIMGLDSSEPERNMSVLASSLLQVRGSIMKQSQG